MSNKSQLSEQRLNTIINTTSKKQEKILLNVVNSVLENLTTDFKNTTLQVRHTLSWKVKDVVNNLKEHFPNIDFYYLRDSSFIKPDGGILSLVDKNNKEYPILISEKKNQGTNDRIISQGKKKQAKGNAIERLGKNVIGFRTAMLYENIFPFVCFGDGCDFSDDSTILDRVVTIAQFGKLNTIHLHNQGLHNQFNRGSFYFKEIPWTEDEMFSISYEIATRSIDYYFSKYGRAFFYDPN